MTTAQGCFTLHRRHDPGSEPLRAWDAADEYALDHAAELVGAHTDTDENQRWVVINDSCGALAVALARASSTATIWSWSDSVQSHEATAANLERNGYMADRVIPIPDGQEPGGPGSGRQVDLAIVKVPRALALLDDQLRTLRGALHPGSIVIGAAMTKSVHRSTIETFEAHIGPTPTTRARKKARLLLPTFDADLVSTPRPDPVAWTTGDGLVITNLPNSFSRQGLDHGTRMLLANLPELDPDSVALDLGCGNGVIAATIAHRNPHVRVVCVDESYHAIDAAEMTLGAIGADATFHAIDVLDGIEGPVDLVVCNPPFHSSGARTTATAERMFDESARVLADDGELRIVANRHLSYHTILKKNFGVVTVTASDPKFVVISARAPKR